MMTSLTCPERGFIAAAPQGLGSHRYRAHGIRGTTNPRRRRRPARDTADIGTTITGYQLELCCPTCAAALNIAANGRPSRLTGRTVLRCHNCTRTWLLTITLTHVRAHHYAPPAPKTARGGLTRITAQPATTQHPLPAHTDDGCTYRKGCGCADCHAISAERRARDRAKVRSA